MSRFTLIVIVTLIVFECDVSSLLAEDDFALRDGDTVVFLGDSLTAARTYGKYIENYSLLRYPNRKIRFVNSGIGGDTADGALKRLERDVFAHRATVLLVMFGTNDIGWGVYADDEHKQRFLNAIRKMCDEGMALSKSLGGDAIDVQRSMREIQKRVVASNEHIKEESKKNTMHLADGTHLNDLGQLSVAFAMLSNWRAA